MDVRANRETLLVRGVILGGEGMFGPEPDYKNCGMA